MYKRLLLNDARLLDALVMRDLQDESCKPLYYINLKPSPFQQIKLIGPKPVDDQSCDIVMPAGFIGGSNERLARSLRIGFGI